MLSQVKNRVYLGICHTNFPSTNESDNEPENVAQPEQGQEKLAYPERSPEEQKIHLERMKSFAEEWGFVQTPELDALRGDIPVWYEKAQQIVNASLDPNGTRRNSLITYGLQVALASIYYERRGPENEQHYWDAMKELCDTLEMCEAPEVRQYLIDTFE